MTGLDQVIRESESFIEKEVCLGLALTRSTSWQSWYYFFKIFYSSENLENMDFLWGEVKW